MKTKKKFFLKAAGISPVKGAGISLALVMMFAACDSDGSSSSGRTPGTDTDGTDTGNVPPRATHSRTRTKTGRPS